MIQSYKQKPELQKQYDVILIGSGLGCLTAAALLAKEGKKALVLERHYTSGGFTHIFKRKGYEWDVGIHYIGEVNRPHTPIRKLFDYISDGKLEWADMGEVYDRIIIGEKKYDFVKGKDNFKEKMIEYFPDEAEAIHKYMDLIYSAQKAMGKYFMEKAIPRFAGKLIGGALRKKGLSFAERTTYEVISELTENQELIKVLCGQYGDYGLPPKQSSFAMHASVVKHFINGGNFPIGGSSEIVNNIDPIIEKSGGNILTNAEVKELIIENNRAVGVRMIDGKTFHAKLIISGTGVINTFEKLVPKSVAERHGLSQKISKVKPSVGHACLYLGLNGSPEELKLPKTNFWIYPEEGDHDTLVNNYLKDNNAPFPVVYVSFPSAKDPSWSSRYPGKSTIDIITLLEFEKVAKWEGTRWMKRGEEYEQIKKSITERLLKELLKQMPHLEGKIDHAELSTPLTTQHFVNYGKGEIYGIDHDPDRFREKFLTPATPIKGFYLTGQDILTAGIGGALFSGLITVSAITKKNFMKKIYK